MANSWGKSGNSKDFTFLGSKITVDGDYRREIKRCLLLGRKAMTNLHNILKSRDFTLLTKVCIVKAVVFPVVIYDVSVGLQRRLSRRINAFECGALESPLDSKEIKPVNPKGNQS